MFWIQPRRSHGRLKVKAYPFLDANVLQFGSSLRQVEEQDQIENDRRRQNRVTAEKIDLDLHGIAEPAEDIDIVPTFFVITAWRIIINADLVENIAVQLGVKPRLQNVFQHAKFRFFLGLKRARTVTHLAIAIAKNVS